VTLNQENCGTWGRFQVAALGFQGDFQVVVIAVPHAEVLVGGVIPQGRGAIHLHKNRSGGSDFPSKAGQSLGQLGKYAKKQLERKKKLQSLHRKQIAKKCQEALENESSWFRARELAN
jgi:hypothetical protein